jgi:hypothetical protein
MTSLASGGPTQMGRIGREGRGTKEKIFLNELDKVEKPDL